MTCWSCSADVADADLACGACRKLQPAGGKQDPFSLLGLPRAFAFDLADLERRFRERSRRLHPDRFARAEPRERRLSLEHATRLNDAYRMLRDWRSRAAYLLKLAGVDVFASGRTLADPDFLEEQLEWREALALARADGDAARLAAIAEDARGRLAALEDEVTRRFGEERWFSELPAEIARCLSRARYYDNIVSDAERASAASSHPRGP